MQHTYNKNPTQQNKAKMVSNLTKRTTKQFPWKQAARESIYFQIIYYEHIFRKEKNKRKTRRQYEEHKPFPWKQQQEAVITSDEI